MRILIAVASRHQATTEIADRIAAILRAELEQHGTDVTVDVAAMETAPPPDRYDAVVLGSAVYLGHWLPSARTYIARQASALAARPVWLFSSGPVGEAEVVDDWPVDLAATAKDIDARGHRTFGGRLDHTRLSWRERMMVAVLHKGDHDYRSWADIDAYAIELAQNVISTHTITP